MTSRLWRRRARPVLLAAAASAVLAAGTLGATDPVATAAQAGPALAAAPVLSVAGLVSGLTSTAASTAIAAPVAAASTVPIGPGGLPTLPYTQCSTTTGVPYATGLPPLPCYLFASQKPGSSSNFTDNGALFSDITQDASRLRTLLQLPDTVSRVFSIICNAVTTGVAARPCPDDFAFDYPTDPSLTSAWLGVAAYIYVQSPVTAKGAPTVDGPQFGVVTQIPVSTLAFGAIPTTATLTVRQLTTSDGYTQPIRLTVPSLTPLYPEGTVLPGYEEYGANPGPDLQQLYLDVDGTGPVQVTLSDLSVDGVPVDLGSDCSTTTDLHVYARGGWSTATQPSVPNGPAEYKPFAPPGYLHAKVDVPAFSGCVSATGEDLSALVTGLASSAQNQLDLTQVIAFTAFGCLTGFTNNCATKHPAVVPPGQVSGRVDG